MANAILNSGVEYDQGKMMYNKYKSVVSYDTTAIPLFSQGKARYIKVQGVFLPDLSVRLRVNP